MALAAAEAEARAAFQALRETDPTAQWPGVPLPPLGALPRAVLRLSTGICRDAAHEALAAADPDAPDVREDSAEVAAAFPGLAAAHLALHDAATQPSADGDKDKNKDDKDAALRHGLAAAYLAGGDTAVLRKVAGTLWARFRGPEAYRLFDRVTRLDPFELEAAAHAMAIAQQRVRPGAGYEECLARISRLPEGVGGGLFGMAPDYAWVRLRWANGLRSIGRLDEAIEAREQTLAAVFGNWSNQNAVLDEWKTSTPLRLAAYAVEGWVRHDLGRTVQGAAAAPIEDGSVLTGFLEALCELGQPDVAVLAWAKHRRDKVGKTLRPDLVACRAMLAVGDADRVPELLVSAELRAPTSEHGPEVNRVLRAAVGAGVGPWRRAIDAALARGARTLAARMARDAADFLPDAAQDPVVLGLVRWPPRGTVSLEALAGLLGAHDDVDALVDGIGDDLASADRAVTRWTEAVAPPPDDAPVEARRRYVERLLWLAARSLTAYLAQSGGASVRLGALRTIADEALQALAWWQPGFSLDVWRALFAGIEQASAVPTWLLDRWLLRIERCLRLDEAVGGHLDLLVPEAPTVGALLRGPERIGLEHLAAAAAGPDEAVPLWHRELRAVGANVSARLSEAVAAASLPADEALDLHQLVTAAHPTAGVPTVEAARLLLERGDGEAAFEVLASRLSGVGATWRAEQLEKLAPLLGSLPVPVAHADAQDAAYRALQEGRPADAVPLLRWCEALDPGVTVCRQNLGLAYALTGQAAEAVTWFSAADAEQGPLWAAQNLYQGGHLAASTAVYRYVTLSPVPVEVWQQCAGIAYAAEDDETSALAYGVLDRIAPHTLDGPSLNAWGGLLDNLGEYGACARVAERLRRIAGDDDLLASCGDHHLACALLGLGRAAEAEPYAVRAVERNPLPDNAGVFGETLALCRADGRRPPVASRRTSPAGRVQGAWARGEAREAQDLADGATDWDVRRAGLGASRLRLAGEEDVRVPARSLRLAARILADSDGDDSVAAGLARAQALRVREDDRFPVDRPPPLGRRIERDTIAHLLGEDLDLVRVELGAVQDDSDVVLFPEGPIPSLAGFAALMRALQGGDVDRALADAGLDLAGLGEVGAAWGAALADDSALAARFRRAVA
ncbi:MAG: hypothetical protein R3F59_03075 [Myxococcota bacterium]